MSAVKDAYNPKRHGQLLFFCKGNTDTLRSVHIYRNGNTFFRGENQAYCIGGAMCDYDIKVKKLSKSAVAELLKEEILLYEEYLTEAISKQQSDREKIVREILDKLNGIYNELSTGKKHRKQERRKI